MQNILNFFFTAGLMFLFNCGQSQDTFSIVALDTETGEIGSAGASCVDNADQFGGVMLLSGIIPGRGAINAQANICIPHVNLNNAIDQMELGLSPDEILDWLYDNDACIFGNNEQRQYGIVDFDSMGAPRSAAFTGSSTLSYAGHRVGANYAIQGNILLGPEILDSMEYHFLNTTGSLAVRLMAALQGANVPGADSRCLDEGTSSKSAFLRVFKPGDDPGNPYLEINVQLAPDGVEPIDSVQVLFDEWITSGLSDIAESTEIKVFPNPSNGTFFIETEKFQNLTLRLYDLSGKVLFEQKLSSEKTEIHQQIKSKGMIIYGVVDEKGQVIQNGKLILN
jgi:uncharacterized Ntn-hydrolase superfamily protein